MAFYFLTGRLGNGKTLSAVGRIRDYLQRGNVIATNLDLNLVALCGPLAQTPRVMRVPDKPSVEDLESIGIGNTSYDEAMNGLLVLDECGTWFNSRNWQDKSRKAVNDWFLHARKLGWDVILIVQDLSLVDSQAREALAEHTVFCRRLDNLNVPIVGSLFKAITGSRLRLPRMHVAKVMYGQTEQDLLADRWVYRGNDLFAAYDTKQLFLADYPHSVFSLLTPWHVVGRYRVPRNREFYMRMTRIVWRRFRSPIALAAGALLGVAATAAAAYGSVYRDIRIERLHLAEERRAAVHKPEQKPIVDPLLEEVRSSRIIGAGVVNTRVYYSFAARAAKPNQDGDIEPAFDAESIRQAGGQVDRISDCHARVRVSGEAVDVYCF